MTETPMTITQGHYGYSYIVEISFTQETLLPWLEQLQEPLPLLLLDTDWIKRSHKEIEFIKQKQFPTGLLGKKAEDYKNLKQLKEEIDLYENVFLNKPLWYTTRDYQFTEDMKKFLFKNKINMLAPSIKWNPSRSNEQLTKGSIVSIPFHEDTVVTTEDIQHLLQQYPFISIEENIFGYSIKKKTFP